MAILEAKGVTYSYRNKYQTVDVLKGVDVSFEEGKLYAIIGKSGSGKSTLLSLLSALDVPEEGEVLYKGTSTKTLDRDRLRRENIAFIYQNFRLFPLLTVKENIAYLLELKGVKKHEAYGKAENLVESVNLPSLVLNRFPGMLSGGEQQRVAVARAMSMDTSLLLADEPTGNLDSENSRLVMDLLLKMAHDMQWCVVVVTHDPSISDRADKVYRMKDGRLEEEK